MDTRKADEPRRAPGAGRPRAELLPVCSKPLPVLLRLNGMPLEAADHAKTLMSIHLHGLLALLVVSVSVDWIPDFRHPRGLPEGGFKLTAQIFVPNAEVDREWTVIRTSRMVPEQGCLRRRIREVLTTLLTHEVDEGLRDAEGVPFNDPHPWQTLR